MITIIIVISFIDDDDTIIEDMMTRYMMMIMMMMMMTLMNVFSNEKTIYLIQCKKITTNPISISTIIIILSMNTEMCTSFTLFLWKYISIFYILYCCCHF